MSASEESMAELEQKLEPSSEESESELERKHKAAGVEENLMRININNNFLELCEVQRQEILDTGEDLEKGCWGEVKVAEFRGIKVAAKYPYYEVSSHIELFMQEVKLATRIHHPNLVLFMGASIVEEAIVLMELMPASDSLWKQLEWREDCLPLNTCISIGLDVARAINYLHLMHPYPVVHRDINSANVMLEPLPLNKWKAKVTDYCFADFKLQHTTGMEAYVEPEAGLHGSVSPEMDIFSYGILLVELCTGITPSVSTCDKLITSIQDPNWLELIQFCIHTDRDCRPSASDIIRALTERQILRTQVSIKLHVKIIYSANTLFICVL